MAEFRPVHMIVDVQDCEMISMSEYYGDFESALKGLKEIKDRLEGTCDMDLYEEQGLLSYRYRDRDGLFYLLDGYYLICTVMPARPTWVSV